MKKKKVQISGEFMLNETLVEMEIDSSKRMRDFKRANTLLNLIGLGDMDQSTREVLTKVCFNESKRKIKEVLDFDLVSKIYQYGVEKMKAERSYLFVKTYKENELFHFLRKITRKSIYPSYVFGGGTFDLYIPSNGLAIEMDGGVHNLEVKMIKDNLKYDFARLFNIMIYSIDNIDLDSKTVQSFIQKINYIPTINSRKRKQQLLKIWIYSIVCVDYDAALELFSISKEVVEKCSFNFAPIFSKYQTDKSLRDLPSRQILIRY